MSFTYRHTFTLAASPDAVFRALTEPDQLRRWFAEEVDVGSAPGEPYRFWGRHTLDAPEAAAASQRLTRWAAGLGIGFTWTIGGVETAVDISLASDDDATTATLRHDVRGDLRRRRQRELIDDHWRLAFGNLAAHLSGGGAIMLPDYSDPSAEVRLERRIAAPPAAVFRALTTPALVNRWFQTTSAEVEPRRGGRYNLNWRYEVEGRQVRGGPTRILAFEQDRHLVLDWPDWRGDESVTGQTISFDLEPDGDGTRLTFVHAGFTRTSDISDFPFGWDWFLGEMAKVATEEAQGAP